LTISSLVEIVILLISSLFQNGNGTTMRLLSWTAAAFISSTNVRKSPSPVCSLVPTLVTELPPVALSHQRENVLTAAIRDYLTVPPAFAADIVVPPSSKEVLLLREALASFYAVDRDAVKAEDLLSQAIEAWRRQAPDERAALYRVRGDCYMALLKPLEAQKDNTIAIDLLEGPGGDLADPSELPAAMYVIMFLMLIFCTAYSRVWLYISHFLFVFSVWVEHVLFAVRVVL
jgi:hypothetical protein